MLSFPFNSSTVMFYINKDAFKKAGLRPGQGAQDLEGSAVAAEKLKAAGQQCVYTTSWPSWMHIENFSAWHNVPIGTKQNGMGGLDTVFTINSPLHVRTSRCWATCPRRACSPMPAAPTRVTPSSSSGECAMFSGSSGGAGEHQEGGQVRVVDGVHPLPRRHGRCAAELHHRRRLGVDHGRQEAG
jgi:sn-glycerol 3-phosphate transport system substrate-binding protein